MPVALILDTIVSLPLIIPMPPDETWSYGENGNQKCWWITHKMKALMNWGCYWLCLPISKLSSMPATCVDSHEPRPLLGQMRVYTYYWSNGLTEGLQRQDLYSSRPRWCSQVQGVFQSSKAVICVLPSLVRRLLKHSKSTKATVKLSSPLISSHNFIVWLI